MQTYPDTQQDLSALLDAATREGAVRIRRSDGKEFILAPDKSESSPLDVEGIALNLTSQEIVEAVRESRHSH